jgi:hypothetical protein
MARISVRPGSNHPSILTNGEQKLIDMVSKVLVALVCVLLITGAGVAAVPRVYMQAARVSPQARWASLRRKPSGQLQLSPRSVVVLCGPANGARRRRKPAKEKIVIHRHSAERGSEIRRRGAPRRRHRRTRRAAHGVVVSLRVAADGRQRIHLPSSFSSPSDSPTPSARSTSNQQGHR